MFFTATSPAAVNANLAAQLRHPAYVHASRSLERFLADNTLATRQKAYTFAQDDTGFTLSFDVPGVAKNQLTIAIEANVVRITSKEGAPRQISAAYELPQDIDTATSSALLENGVLTLKLAKKLPVSNATELVIG